MAKSKSQLKWKRKTWYEIQAPGLFNRQKLGETPASEEDQLIRRTIYKNVGRLLNDKSRRYMKLKFRITEIEEDKAKTEIEGFRVSKNHIYKLVQQGTRKIEINKKITTKEGKEAKIQVLVIPTGRASKKKRKTIINKSRKEIDEIAEKHNLQALFLMVISQDVQKGLKSSLNSIYPVRYVEVKKVEPLTE